MRKRVDFIVTWKRIAAAFAGVVAAALVVSLSGMVSIAASSGHFAPVGWFLHWTMQNAVSRQSLGIAPPPGTDLSDPALVQRAAGHFATGCAACHGAPGVAQSPVVEAMTPAPPRLEGHVGEWADRELFWILQHGIKYSGMPAWPTQERRDEVWAQVAFLRALPEMSAERYADLALGGGRGDDPLEAGGESLASLDGVEEVALEDCARCHGRNGLGRGTGESRGAFPIIAGQPEAYLLATLKAYADGDRHSGFMQPPAKRYDTATLAALARWYSQRPRPGQAAPVAGDPAPDDEGSQTADAIPPQIFPADARGANTLVATAAAGAAPRSEGELMELGRLLANEGIPARKIPACETCHAPGGAENTEHIPYLGGQPAWYAETHLTLWKEDKRGGTRYAHLMQPIAEQMTEEQIRAVALWYSHQRPQD